MKRATNKYGVPYHLYQLHLADGSNRWVDIGDESDWGNIQQMNPGDWFVEGETSEPIDWNSRVGWGNDCDGHIEITDVIDLENEKHLIIRDWANEVWDYADRYSA